MVEKWFVILMVIVNILSMGIAIGKHGEPKDGEYNAWASLIATCIFFTLAWLGGLFRCFE